MSTTLQSRNILIDRHRTSMRLEPEMWEALTDIARREGLSVNHLCSRVSLGRKQSSLTSAMRVFVLAYYRCAADWPGQPDLIERAMGRA
ncbi:MAG: ribbon-helix-helix domain-containing protein [Elsteraceae bacterium]